MALISQIKEKAMKFSNLWFISFFLLGVSGEAICSNINETAAAPISRHGWWTVVNGTG